MKNQIIAGVDIGSSKIASIDGISSPEEKTPRIIGFNTTPAKGVRKGLIVDIDQVTAAVEESIEKAERMAGHKVNNCFVSVGGPHISSLNSHGIVAVAHPEGEISIDDVNRAIEAARAISLSNTKQIIEVSPRDFIVNGQSGIKNPVGMSGVRLEVDTHIITASQTNLKNIERCLNELGLQNNGFVFAGLASAESCLTDTEKELGVALVDIGGGKIDLAIYIEGALAYSSSLPIGARHITNDIAVGLRVSLDSAEKIKIEISNNSINTPTKLKTHSPNINLTNLNLPENLTEIPLKTLTDGIIAPRLEEIYKLIFEEIEKSTFANLIPSGLVITGGGALTAGMLETGRRILGLPIRLGTPQGVTGLIDEIIHPPFATCIGLLLYQSKNLAENEANWKNFNRILKDISLDNSLAKIKNFFKQFIP